MSPEIKFSRMPEDTYSLEEVKSALESWKGRIAESVMQSVLDRMEQEGLGEVPKKFLNNTEYELLDQGLFLAAKRVTGQE